MASMIKWRLLAVSGHTLREVRSFRNLLSIAIANAFWQVDLILGLSSFQKVLELLWTWTRGSRTVEDEGKPVVSKRLVFRLGAFAWILLGLVNFLAKTPTSALLTNF